MINELREWINGKRDYATGARLYARVGDNQLLKAIFLKPKTDFSYQTLQEELMAIYLSLKSQQDVTSTDAPLGTATSEQTLELSEKTQGHRHRQSHVSDEQKSGAHPGANPDLPVNGPLYEAALSEARKVYKEAMNARAVLFKMIPSVACEDPNRPDLVEQRRQLSLDVVNLYNHASELFDRADYVKRTGKLPDEENSEKLPDPSTIHEVLVYYTLTSYQKNLNKMKARAGKVQESPERVQAMQEYESHIKTLSDRWHSLKSTYLK